MSILPTSEDIEETNKSYINQLESKNKTLKTIIQYQSEFISKVIKLIKHKDLDIGCYYGCKAQGGNEENCESCQIIQQLKDLVK